MDLRSKDATIAPTSFLWNAYRPSRYYFEVGNENLRVTGHKIRVRLTISWVVWHDFYEDGPINIWR